MRCLSCLMLGCALLLPALSTEADAGFKGRFGHGPGLTVRHGVFSGRGFRHRLSYYGRFSRHDAFAGRYGFRRFGFGRYGALYSGYGSYGLWPGVQAFEPVGPDPDVGPIRSPLGDPYANVPGIAPSPVAPPVIYVLDGDRGSRARRGRKATLRFGAGRNGW